MTSSKMPEARGPKRADILAAVHKKGKTLAALASAAGEPQHLLYVTMHRSSSLRGEIIIAEFLEVDPRVLWPDRWQRLTPKREVWLLKNAEKLEAWRGNRLEDVGR